MHIHKVIHHSNHICKQNRLDTAIISLNNHINKQIHKQKTLKWKQHLDKFDYEHNLHSMWGTIAKPFNKNPPTKQNRRIPFETKTTMAGIDKLKVLNKQFINVTPYSTTKSTGTYTFNEGPSHRENTTYYYTNAISHLKKHKQQFQWT